MKTSLDYFKEDVMTLHKQQETKTIMEAVNELRGINNNWSKYICYCEVVGFYLATSNLIDSICTTEEFNTLISELETNSGKSITYNEFKKIRDGIDWGDVTSGRNAVIRLSDGRIASTDEANALFINKEWVFIERPQPQKTPVYTPKVGDTVIIEDVYGDIWDDAIQFIGVESEVMAVFKSIGEDVGGIRFNIIAVSLPNGLSACFRASMARNPINLIDGECYQFNHGSFKDLKGAYYDGSITNHIGVYDADDCTNIRPLTLKGE